MTIKSNRFKVGLSYAVNLSVLAIALYVEEIRRLSPPIQLGLVLFLAATQLITSNIFDYIREKTANIILRSQARQLRLERERTRTELDELKQVVASFLEHSEIYREKVKDQLRLTEDYLCIVKSSEGLSDVYKAMDKKAMLPFGATLLHIPGSVRPFERISLFLIPTRSLPGINEWNVRQYIDKEIIPEVEAERARFLAQVRPDVAAKAEPFSFKYIAFLLRRGTIAHDVRNRKFNREFNAFIVEQQTGPNYSNMRNHLAEMVRAKDLLSLVNWASFAQLNNEQSALVGRTKHQMSERLAEAGVDKLPQVAQLTPEEFLLIVWPLLRRRTTKRKALNLSKKIVQGASNTVEVLRKHGVTL